MALTSRTTFAQNGVRFEAEDANQWLDLTGVNANSTEGVQQSVGGIFGTTSTDGLYINSSEVNTFENSNAEATGLNWQQFMYNFTATGPTYDERIRQSRPR